MERLEAISDLDQIHRSITGSCCRSCSTAATRSDNPARTTPRGSGKTEEFLRMAYDDFPLVLPEICEYWSPRETTDTPDST